MALSLDRFAGCDPALFRHVAACNNAQLPGDRRPFRLAGTVVGWIDPDRVAVDAVADQSELDRLCAGLAAAGVFRPRGERFDIRAEPDGPVLGELDRGAIPVLGCRAEGVHLNGLVHRADGLWLWVGRRAANKPLDPGKLDHIAAGGIPAGYRPLEALCKEAAEEAGLPETLVRGAVPAGTISYTMRRAEGLRRDRLHVFDLLLPPGIEPRPVDGEVVGFELWPLPRVLEAVRETDLFKFNVNLVLIDLLLRHGSIDGASASGRAISAALRSGRA